MNKLITIEGTDCAGKSTQLKLLISKLKEKNINVECFKFPNYDSPTGRIVGECYLGRSGKGFFKEGASNVNPKVASLLYAADRVYNIGKVKELLENNHVILDRYIDSNIAYNGAKITDKEERFALYNFLIQLEYNLLELPKPEIKILLYMPSEFSKILKAGRQEIVDEHEKDEAFLLRVENAYLEVAELLGYKIINCVENNQIRTIESISKELVEFVESSL